MSKNGARKQVYIRIDFYDKELPEGGKFTAEQQKDSWKDFMMQHTTFRKMFTLIGL